MTLLAFGLSPSLLRPPLCNPGPGCSIHVRSGKPFRHNALRIVRSVPTASMPLPVSAMPRAARSLRTLAAVPTVRFTIRDRLSFWLGEYLMWNPGAKVIALFLLTLLGMAVGSLLFRVADPKREEAQSPFWHSVRAIANPLEDDWASVRLRAVSVTLATVGMVVFAILVGMVTETVETAVRNADGRHSKVLARDHIVILGWGHRVPQTLKDLNNVGLRDKVVVLANSEDKESMMEELRDIMSSEERGHLRLFYRWGAPVISEDLNRVSAGQAKKIVLVNSRTGDPVDADRRVLSRAVALSQNLPTFTGDIVAELNNSRDEGILRSILSRTNARSVETVNAERLLFRFMAQAIRQPGLADVVATLMGGDKSTVFHVRKVSEVAPQLAGVRYTDVQPTALPGAIICGYFTDDGNVHIESTSKSGPTLHANTNLLLLGLPGSRGAALPAPAPEVDPLDSGSGLRFVSTRPTKNDRAETFLICGWRPDMEDMLRELDTTLPHGSRMTILDDDAPKQLDFKLRNLTVTSICKRPDRFENLEALLGTKASSSYDHIVLLGSALGLDDSVSIMGADEDSKALATMVYVNELLSNRKDGQRTLVTIEFNNERVAEIAREQGNVANAILPQNLSAKIAAQTMRDSRLNAVWRELLSQRGREVYLVPVAKYVDAADGKKSFATIANDAADNNDDIVIGFIAKGAAPTINPMGKQRNDSRSWLPGDYMIVLSEDK